MQLDCSLSYRVVCLQRCNIGWVVYKGWFHFLRAASLPLSSNSLLLRSWFEAPACPGVACVAEFEDAKFCEAPCPATSVENREEEVAPPPTMVAENCWLGPALSRAVVCLLWAAFHLCCKLVFMAENEVLKLLLERAFEAFAAILEAFYVSVVPPVRVFLC